jgi:hypothetical protein
MPIRYDALLARALATELGEVTAAGRLEELHFDAARRCLVMVFTGGLDLAWVLHPSSGHLLLRRPEGTPRRRRARTRGLLQGPESIEAVTTRPDERRITFESPRLSIVIELHTNQWNALLVENGVIRNVLWPRTAGGRALFRNAPYRPPGDPRTWAAGPPTEIEWQEWWKQTSDTDRATALVRDVAWTSRINTPFILSSPADPAEVHSRLLSLHPESRPDSPPSEPRAWLLRRKIWQPYPLSLDEASAKSCDSLISGMRESMARSGIEPPGFLIAEGTRVSASAALEDPSGHPAGTLDREREALDAALRSRLTRARRRTAALLRQLEQGEESGEIRAAAQLLLMHKDRISRGASSVSLTDFDGTERRISLDPALDAIANAERYFERARRREKAERDVPALLAAAREREADLVEALQRLEAEGPADGLWELAGGRDRHGPGPARVREEVALPYRRLVSVGGLEIRVGRSARANDDLTFSHSSPDDIWLHARQAAGAHVILRWGRRNQNPPAADLRDAARVAAEYSEARSSGMVPVDWTRKKYVRKPRKSPPGVVVPDRVQTIFVEPDPERVRKMKEEGPDAP